MQSLILNRKVTTGQHKIHPTANKMKKQSLNIFKLLLILTLFTGCLSSNSFKYKSREALVLGKTTQSELFQIVGQPNETETQKIGSKTYTKLSYLHIGRGPGNPPRVLTLEVVDGVLNGFNGSSAYKNEEINVARLAYDKIVEHQTKVDDVINEFGFPSGQVMAPSTFGFADKVASGNQVFTWQQWLNGQIKGAIFLVVDPSTKTIISKNMITK